MVQSSLAILASTPEKNLEVQTDFYKSGQEM